MTDAIESRFDALEALSAEYAQAQAEAEQIAHFRKSKLAILMRDAEKAGHKSAVIQEREALANSEYIELLDGLQTATEAALKLKWRLEIAKMRFEAWRSVQANRRAEANLR
jgi:hypothetical protein